MSMPCLFFPTTLVYVDDEEKALKFIEGALGFEWHLKLFNDPRKALEFLTKSYKPTLLQNRWIVESEDVFPDHSVIDYNIRAIRDEINNKNRSNEIAVVIIDYAMHSLNGGELAKQLKDMPYKIILLTGEADTQTAVNLFNEGVIDSYIRKDDKNIKAVLIDTIKKLQWKFFEDLSRSVMNSFANQKWPSDPVYIKSFQETIRAHNLVEGYILDEYGSYEFLTADGKRSFLAVTNSEMMECYLDFAEDASPVDVVEGIRSKKVMPFFLNTEDFDLSPKDWRPFIHPAKELKGSENYYYSYIQNPDSKIYKLDKKIFSYDEFLRSQG